MSFRWSQGAVSLHSTLPWAVGSLPLRGASLTLTTFPPFHLTVGYMRLCPCGLDPQSHTISHATRCVPTLIAGSCWVGHGGAHAFFRYIPLSVETLRATSPFGYVRDARNVSIWVCSRCVQRLRLNRQRVCWRRSTLRLYAGWVWDVFSLKLLRLWKLWVVPCEGS